MPLRTPLLTAILMAAAWLTPGVAPLGGVTRVMETVFVRDPAVRAIPIEQRPNRLGHIYGNTYRRAYYGRVFVNQGRFQRPVATYLYQD